jgi:hypothetical protein
MKTTETYQWLMENGGPVIRYRTATELMAPDKTVKFQKLRDDLLKSPLALTWLEQLTPAWFLTQELTDQRDLSFAINSIHGSKPALLENVMGKLTDFGLKKGIPELDSRTLLYRKWLTEHVDSQYGHFFGAFLLFEIAAFLARAGYSDEPAVRDNLKRRLDIVYQTACGRGYDIYEDPAGYRKMPANFRGRGLINQDLTREGNIALPLVYDMIGWPAFLASGGSKEDRAKMDVIIGYIFRDEYQKLPWGYGAVTDGKGHYWSCGWSVNLPGFSGVDKQAIGNYGLLQMADIMFDFSAARRQPWSKECLAHLEQFKTPDGTYLFPREYLPEKPAAYWVVGGKMALEENPRNQKALEIESTFRMAVLQKKISISD